MSSKYPLPPIQNILALACTNVGVGPGGATSMLARVSVVDYRGHLILDTFVAPTMKIEDYRGLDPSRLQSNSAVHFNIVQQHVADVIRGKIVVGHSLWNDLSVLGIPHPAVATRDVALYKPFRNALRSPNQIIGLPTLMWHLMCRRCQDGPINPLENSRASLDLYRSHSNEWETAVSRGNWPSHLPPSTFSRCYL